MVQKKKSSRNILSDKNIWLLLSYSLPWRNELLICQIKECQEQEILAILLLLHG